MFCKDENNLKVLGEFLREAQATHVEDASRAARLDISKRIISYIYKSPEGWDDRCSFNIGHIGGQFIRFLEAFDSSKITDIDHIYCMSYRFLCEFDFLIGPGRELSAELRSIKNKIENDAGEMDEDVRSQIIYASYVMPASVTREFVNDPNIGFFKDLEQKKVDAENLKKQWEDDIGSKESSVN